MLICLVTLEMTTPEGYRRVWRGQPDDRDWDVLEYVKRRDGWKTISHRREFVERHDLEEPKDAVEFAK